MASAIVEAYKMQVAVRDARIAELEAALRVIAANTYGTELGNTDEDNLDIVFRHLRSHQEIARAALAKR